MPGDLLRTPPLSKQLGDGLAEFAGLVSTLRRMATCSAHAPPSGGLQTVDTVPSRRLLRRSSRDTVDGALPILSAICRMLSQPAADRRSRSVRPATGTAG